MPYLSKLYFSANISYSASYAISWEKGSCCPKRCMKSVWKKLIDKLKHLLEHNVLLFFSDEKTSAKTRRSANKTTGGWPFYHKDVLRVMQTKLSVITKVFGVLINEGDVMPPHVFPEDLGLDTNGYISILRKVMKPRIDGTNGRR